jgi:diguanylate cyclase (GGDEF)-like protein
MAFGRVLKDHESGAMIFRTSTLVSAALFFAGAFAAGAAPPAPLGTLRAIEALSNAEAARHLPVSFEATVTYYRAADKGLFAQDGPDAIYIQANRGLDLIPGDRIRIEGTTHESFRPYVVSDRIERVGHSNLPKPERPTFQQMIRGETDCKLVTIRAQIRSADLMPASGDTPPFIFLRLLVDGGPVDADINNADENSLRDLLDAEVEMTGPMSGHFDAKMQQTGVLLHVQSPAGIRILKRAKDDPWSLPLTPMDRVITGYHSADLSQRIRVQGTITYFAPGSALVLQDGSKSLWIRTESFGPLQIGDRATAIGFPDVQNGFLTLTHSEIRDSSTHTPVTPQLLKWRDLAMGGNSAPSHIFDLVSIEGRVIAQVRQPTQDVYVLNADGSLFSATLDHDSLPNQSSLAPMTQVDIGSRLRVTGICIPKDSNPFLGEVPFNILMRSASDVTVVAAPPWMDDERHTMIIAGILLAIVLVLGGRGWLLEHKTRREIGSLAYVEQRRGRILESINSSDPLADILERVTELVSVRLNGAPCWCQIADGAKLGNRPAQLGSTSLRIVERPIAARSGPPLGIIYAAFDARTKPTTLEQEALAMAAGLATLAIETSRLYADLVRRSEFDVLTDVQNRFAMERSLDAMIHNARQSAGIFAVIFIDLNDFKQVNDLHGHLVGDLYLQEVTQRMKRQLRPDDTLARVGGDEFAVLVPEIRNRDEASDIAMRLEACFVEPFMGDGYVLNGSASIGIALYPEDATTADGLLSNADAAMYMAKFTRKGLRAGRSDRDLASREHF